MDIGLLNASDEEIFFKARDSNAIVLSKDMDFVNLLDKYHSPPKVIWLCLRVILKKMIYLYQFLKWKLIGMMNF